MRRIITIISAGLLCGGCASVSPKQYANEKPELDLCTYLEGPLEAWGMFQNRKGDVVKRFHVAMVGTWSNNVGRLEEDFAYSDGTTQRRVWNIRRLDKNSYEGTADDVVGTAKGQASGNALNWRYTLALPVGKKVYNVAFDDWMFLVDEKTMLNRATVRKFGFRVGEVIIFFRKSGGNSETAR